LLEFPYKIKQLKIPTGGVKSKCGVTACALALKATHREIFSKHGAKNPRYLQNVEQMAQSLPQLQRHGCPEVSAV